MQTRRQFLGSLAASALSLDPWGAPRAAAAQIPDVAFWPFRTSELIARVTRSTAAVHLVAADPVYRGMRARVQWAPSAAAGGGAAGVSAEVPCESPGAAALLPLDGLLPNREYTYRVEVKGEATQGAWRPSPNIGRFVTQRDPGEAFRFCVMADGHWGRGSLGPGDMRRWSGVGALTHIVANGPWDFALELGDAALYPDDVRSPDDALSGYLRYRDLLSGIGLQMPIYLALGNHELEAGFFQHGSDARREPSNDLGPGVFHQEWSTAARLRAWPNPMPDTYPEGGEGAADTETLGEWLAPDSPRPAALPGPLQNFYAFTWGPALFVVLDPLRYTRVASLTRPNSPSQWTLGPTQLAWLERTLRGSPARWKFVVCHHLVGGGLIDTQGAAIVDGGASRAYGRGTAIDAIRPGTEQARIHALMRETGVQFFLYGHDHVFCHSVQDNINYLCCGRPTFLNDWLALAGMQSSYGSVLAGGADKPWIRALRHVLGYTQFEVTPDSVSIAWIRTGYSFRAGAQKPDAAKRDFRECWFGREFPVDSGGVQVDMVPSDVDAVRVAGTATPTEFASPPAGLNYYAQPFPRRPEKFTAAFIPVRDFPAKEAAVDAVPDVVHRHTWRYGA